ncbi:MAG: hypothetical protein PVH29_05275 [Candidatus Zixiibacteriota bacterium]|jgi:DNA-binding beta-propeller fold protein YncE
MLNKKTLIAACVAAVALSLFTGCDPDTEGGGSTPITGLRIWVAEQPNKTVAIYDEDSALIKVAGDRNTFSKPNSLDVYEKNGATWVCDFYTNRVRKFNSDGELVYSSPGEGQGFIFLNPTGLSVGQASGECWVADRGNNRVVRLSGGGDVLARVTGLSYPRNVSVDPSTGDVWIADEGNDAVVKISGSATGDAAVAAVEKGRYADLDNPWAVAADGDGRAWASSRSEGRVVRLSAKGAELASVSGFDAPVRIAVDETAGAVFVVDAERGVLVAFPYDLSGTYQNYTTPALFVVPGLANPEDVYADVDEGRVYVADMGAGTVEIYDTAGNAIKTVTGLSGPAAVAAWEED